MQEVHLRRLDGTQCIKRETSELCHMVKTRVGRGRLGDDLIYYRDSIGFAPELTLREVHDALWARHSKVVYEHEIQHMVNLSYKRVFGHQVVLGCINRFTCVIWQE